MWQEYHNVSDMPTAIAILAAHGSRARIIAGATDLILEMERKVRTGIDILVDVTRVAGQDLIYLDENGYIHLGPLVTHNQCVASPVIRKYGLPLALAAWQVGAPQIRNRGTIAGNLITASPANDTITPLMALDTSLVLQSQRGRRIVPLREFYTGVRKTIMLPDEILVDIFFKAMGEEEKGNFVKIGLRNAQAISVVNAAVVLKLDARKIIDARVALGSVAPTIIRSREAERILKGHELSAEIIHFAASAAVESCSPIDDIRGTAAYRKEMVRVSVHRALSGILSGDEAHTLPIEPILLSLHHVDPSSTPKFYSLADSSKLIKTTINDQEYTFINGHNKTLLRLLREDAGLIGTKEGCAEGECGACTVILDEMAVMSCLVPAPRAHGARIYTIEGLSKSGVLHPVQKAFIETGAVQCGYCTPGFIMSAAMLLKEKPNPSRDDILTSITGNLCRCTGYYKIIEAIEKSAAARIES